MGETKRREIIRSKVSEAGEHTQLGDKDDMPGKASGHKPRLKTEPTVGLFSTQGAKGIYLQSVGLVQETKREVLKRM